MLSAEGFTSRDDMLYWVDWTVARLAKQGNGEGACGTLACLTP
jgi:hypothetical protein